MEKLKKYLEEKIQDTLNDWNELENKNTVYAGMISGTLDGYRDALQKVKELEEYEAKRGSTRNL